jgi:hypothetical protein
MKKKVKDRHLDVPSEANRDKHINYTALERNEKDPADLPATGKLADKKQQKDKENEEGSRNKTDDDF